MVSITGPKYHLELDNASVQKNTRRYNQSVQVLNI